MSIEGVDFSSARPGGAALAAAGKRFVLRYLTNAGAALNTDVKTALGTLQAAMAEPAQTPAGRALLAAIETVAKDGQKHGDDIESLQNFQTEIRSAMKFLRGLVTASAAVSGLAAAAQLLHLHFGP